MVRSRCSYSRVREGDSGMAKKLFLQVKLCYGRREGDGPPEPGISEGRCSPLGLRGTNTILTHCLIQTARRALRHPRATVPRSLESRVLVANRTNSHYPTEWLCPDRKRTLVGAEKRPRTGGVCRKIAGERSRRRLDGDLHDRYPGAKSASVASSSTASLLTVALAANYIPATFVNEWVDSQVPRMVLTLNGLLRFRRNRFDEKQGSTATSRTQRSRLSNPWMLARPPPTEAHSDSGATSGTFWTPTRRRMVAFAVLVASTAVAAKAWLPHPAAEAQTPRSRVQQRGRANPPQRGAQPRRPAPQPPGGQAAAKTGGANVVAVVNREPITRQELGQLCLARWGVDTLEGLVNKQLITEACRTRGIVIAENDVDEEIRSIASQFNMSAEQYLKMIKDERDVSATEYRRDIIWPAIALKRLAADQIQVTQEDLRKEFEAEFGEKRQVRVISLTSRSKAEEVVQLAQANPDDFGRLAKQYSADPNSASAKGLIPPISKHVGDPTVEKVVFAMQEGQVSGIVEAANQYHIFKCERHLPAAKISPQYQRQAVTRLRTRIVDRNLRKASASIFAELQSKAEIVNVMNDPQRRKQSPGVAAFVNGRPITREELTEECLLRFSRDMLESEITYRLLRQALKQRGLQVPQTAINDEVARLAMSLGFIKSDGSADMQAWLKEISEKAGVSPKEYIRDSVWPSAALKQLVDQNVTVTEEDLAKGFEANFGERVEVLAIVLSNQRTAQEVWDMARKRPTQEFFGELAEQYSIEPISRANYGEIPPIQRHGGQPQIEKEAFDLKPGELSGIIAMGDKYIIMKCLGRTEPVVTDPTDVREELTADIHEKKLRIAMAEVYDQIRESAQIDNFLDGTSQTGNAKLRLPSKVPVRPVSSGRTRAGR